MFCWGVIVDIVDFFTMHANDVFMPVTYLQSSSLVFMSHETLLQAILHFYLVHYANKSFWLAFYIAIRITHGQIVI